MTPLTHLGALDVLFQADWHYYRGEYQRAYDITRALLERDPYHTASLPVHLAAALELRRKNELFARAHKLMQEYPDRAVAWLAVGCYYYCIRAFDNARRCDSHATTTITTTTTTTTILNPKTTYNTRIVFPPNVLANLATTTTPMPLLLPSSHPCGLSGAPLGRSRQVLFASHADQRRLRPCLARLRPCLRRAGRERS
eukprot:8297020-Pyramimonas_sp.AAC.1